MKRSEMINLLTTFVKQKTNWCFDDSLMFSQELLQEIEQFGMLPPVIHWSKTKQENPDYNNYINAWEDEIDCGAV